MSVISPEVQERIQLWGRHPVNNREQWPDWYVYSGGWYESDCHNTVYVTWNIDKNSTVFDVGGYEGAWSRRIVAKYDPTLHFFEPIPRAYDIAATHLRHYPKVHMHRFAVGSEDAKVTFHDSGRDGAGIYAKGGSSCTVQMYRFSTVLQSLNVDHIDMMACNIEGSEYDLLPHMIETGVIKCVQQMMIQWHWRMEGDHARKLTIQERLAQTHEMDWNYSAHEAWKRKA